MKIRYRYEDFQVEEISSAPAPAPHRGGFAVYRMLKRGKTTTDAMGILERAWHIRPGALSFDGLRRPLPLRLPRPCELGRRTLQEAALHRYGLLHRMADKYR